MSATTDAAAVTPRPGTARRGWVAGAVLVGCAFFVLGALIDALAPGPQGPAESSYSTIPAGLAAWSELLTRAGHPVRQLRGPLTSAQLPGDRTLVIFGAESLTRAEGRNLDRFVARGGRLVIGGGDPERTLPVLLGALPRWSSGGPRLFQPVPGASVPENRRVAAVISAGEGSWPRAPGGAVLVAPDGAALLVVKRAGAGRIELLADPSVVENRLLASADNAQLAINLAGEQGRPVVFVESLHGFGEATGLAALPTRWWVAFAGLMLAAGAWALSRGRRLGPAEPPAPPGAPARSGYVDAMVGALLRTRDPAGLDELARTAIERAGRRSGA